MEAPSLDAQAAPMSSQAPDKVIPSFADWKAPPLSFQPLLGFSESVLYAPDDSRDPLAPENFQAAPLNPLDAIPNGFAILKVIGGSPQETINLKVHIEAVSKVSAYFRAVFSSNRGEKLWIIRQNPAHVHDIMSIVHYGHVSLHLGARRDGEHILALCYLAQQYQVIGSVRHVLRALMHVDSTMGDIELWWMFLAAALCHNPEVFRVAARTLLWRYQGPFAKLATVPCPSQGVLFQQLQYQLAFFVENCRNRESFWLREAANMVDPKLWQEMFPYSVKGRSISEQWSYLSQFCQVKVVVVNGYRTLAVDKQNIPNETRGNMISSRLLWMGFWVPLISGTAGQEAPPGPEMRLIACAKPAKEISKHLEAEWEAARSSTEFPMAWIKHCADAPASAYPSIKLLRGDQPAVDFLGPLTSDEILRFVDRARRSSQVPSRVPAEEAESFGNVDAFVCVAHLEPGETALRKAFETVAQKYWAEFTFGVVDGSGTAEARVVCRKGDDTSTHTTTLADGLEAWVLEASRPVIAELTPLNHQRFIDRAWPIVYIFSPSTQVRASIRASLHDFAKKQYASLTPVTVDPNRFPDLPARLGLDPGVDGYPAGAVHQISNGRIYPYPRGKAFTPRELQGWGLDVWQGRVKPWTPLGQKPVEDDTAGGRSSVVGLHRSKVKVRIGGRERDEL
ncbi:hypothetical protein CORC01_10911 [Colletotrichum orchidophilum]|uniref:Uncharacterized protein n=1 Tax=Colletotrichum orchidophilum TaxID=1209926 RepID=A0A1G4AXE8_9PEZI|nr:uncharacterized protein CORC01_10911 [Colletotrichum orchidophilum]OHE93785.1 hypothetical protein CORC01_10911 [Colletotrichum orchidophilum]